MIELKCKTKIKWRDSSLSIKEGIIVRVIHDYRTYGTVKILESFYYSVIESDTGTYYDVKDKDITLVNIDGEWIEYKPSNRSGRYFWDCDAADSIKNFIDNNVKNYIENDRKAMYDFIKHSIEYRISPKKVIFNGPATIVLWKDGTKTIVKRREGEADDREKAVMYCILKKLCDGKAPMDKYLKLFLKEEESNEEKEEAGSSKLH